MNIQYTAVNSSVRKSRGLDLLNLTPQGPYKQYMGRSKNTGNLTVVLYEDPPDGIPKMHIRSTKYMAWIAEQQMPVHMHVEKVS